MPEIKLVGRWGQGMVTASQMLDEAYSRAGMYLLDYTMLEGERRGAPVAVFLEENALVGVCGMVCYAFCQLHSKRAPLDGAVHVKAVERAAFEMGTSRPLPLYEDGRE